MKLRSLFLAVLVGVCLQSAFHGPARGQAPAPELPPNYSFAKDVFPFLTKHCFACHGDGKKKGGVTLDKYPNEAAVRKNRKDWEHILDVLRAGEMPPKEKPQPVKTERDHALAAIDAVLHRVD